MLEQRRVSETRLSDFDIANGDSVDWKKKGTVDREEERVGNGWFVPSSGPSASRRVRTEAYK